jgi:hypothetical protein
METGGKLTNSVEELTTQLFWREDQLVKRNLKLCGIELSYLVLESLESIGLTI